MDISRSNDENFDCKIQPSSNQLICNVRNCQNKSCYTYFELIKHIQEFHTVNLTQNQFENKPTSDLIICPWENCFFEGNLVQMRVHLYYHARLCMLKDIGQRYISKKDLPTCGIADKSLNCSDSSLYNKYQCKWKIDNEKSNIYNLLYFKLFFLPFFLNRLCASFKKLNFSEFSDFALCFFFFLIH